MQKITEKYLKDQYTKELSSGMFFERFPEFTGDYQSDKVSYKTIVKQRLEEIQEFERLKGLWKRDIEDAIKTQDTIGGAPNDRKVFKVGESVSVSHGGFISAVIEEILSQGVYNVFITYKTTKPYSKEEIVLTKNMVLGWWGIWKLCSEPSEDMSGERLEIQFMQQDISSLLHKYFDDRGVNMNPSYQRGLVWTDTQREELLDSVFNYIDIGKFVFVKLPYVSGGFSYEILDGKQKLTTLVDFYQDKFKYKGYYYSELNWKMRQLFKNRSVSVGEVGDRTYNEKNVLKYFVMLNTAGTPMSKEHLDKIKDGI